MKCLYTMVDWPLSILSELAAISPKLQSYLSYLLKNLLCKNMHFNSLKNYMCKKRICYVVSNIVLMLHCLNS